MNDYKHLMHYLVLVSGLFVSLLLFIYFRYNRQVQFFVGTAGAFFYILWGVVHHALEERLTKKIIAEYVLIGSLVVLLLLTAYSL